jgi:Fe-S cluster assembly protein SufD
MSAAGPLHGARPLGGDARNDARGQQASAASVHAHYRDEFERIAHGLAGAQLSWLRDARREALDRFAEIGFPTARDEDWKYTNVAPIERRAFRVSSPASGGLDAARADALALAGTHRLVFVDGRYDARLSRVPSQSAGVTLRSLAGALADDAQALAPLFAPDAATLANGFDALNAAFWTDGAHIDVAAGTAVDEPIELLFVSTAADTSNHVRTVIRCGAGSRVSVVEHYVGLDDIVALTNASTSITLEDGSAIEHCKLQRESRRAFHVGAIRARQGRGSRFASGSFALGAALSRNDIATRLDAEGCDTTLDGLYMVEGRQHVDHHTCIDHAKPRGTSRELYKGVLDGTARAVFNGKVIVRPDAQKSDAHQSNRNLLLSEGAEVDTKPQLEIYADDVKCSHGATVGQLDENQVFYVRSRGVDEAVARTLLTHAFAAEIVDRCGIAPLRDRLRAILSGRLADAGIAGALS